MTLNHDCGLLMYSASRCLQTMPSGLPGRLLGTTPPRRFDSRDKISVTLAKHLQEVRELPNRLIARAKFFDHPKQSGQNNLLLRTNLIHPTSFASPNSTAQRAGPANDRNISTYAKRACNSRRICTSIFTGLKSLWNQHLQKIYRAVTTSASHIYALSSGRGWRYARWIQFGTDFVAKMKVAARGAL